MYCAADGSDIIAPASVVESLNERFQDDACGFLYFTAVYGVLNTATGEGALCQAGHPNPVVQTGGAMPGMIGNGGFPVGMLADISYETVAFEPGKGDRLIRPDAGKAVDMSSGADSVRSSRSGPAPRPSSAVRCNRLIEQEKNNGD